VIEIVPRWPGSKPGSVAAVSLATDTTTPMLASFSTSKENDVGEGTGPVDGSGAVEDAVGLAVAAVAFVLGCGEEHAETTTSTATNALIPIFLRRFSDNEARLRR
jgi:hypothetical protein